MGIPQGAGNRDPGLGIPVIGRAILEPPVLVDGGLNPLGFLSPEVVVP